MRKLTGNSRPLRSRLMTMITVVVALLFLLQVLIEGFWFRSRLQEATSSELDIAITIGLIFKPKFVS